MINERFHCLSDLGIRLDMLMSILNNLKLLELENDLRFLQEEFEGTKNNGSAQACKRALWTIELLKEAIHELNHTQQSIVNQKIKHTPQAWRW